jgi:uncharacterized protein (DUF2225 family)
MLKNDIAQNIAQNDIAEKTYDKHITCPVCNSNVSVKAVKSKYIRVDSRDSDFMIRYKEEPNPMFYDIWLCDNCGYAAMSSKFENVSDTQIKRIKEEISGKWCNGRNYSFPYTVDTAIELHKLALVSSIVKEDKDSEKGYLCLKLAWLYRIKGDIDEENSFLKRALVLLLKAYENEKLPVIGLDGPNLMYLIGELYRRLDDNANALRWFGMVLANRDATAKIKDMAREQKDLIKAARCNSIYYTFEET